MRKFLSTIKRIIKMSIDKSFHPEKKRKNFFRRLYEIVRWQIKYGNTDIKFYNLYGLDVEGSLPQDLYLYNQTTYPVIRQETYMGQPQSMVCLIYDKFLFYHVLKSNNIPTPEVFAFYLHGIMYTNDMQKIDLDALKDRKDYFLKDVYGVCGHCIKHISDYDELLNAIKDLPDGGYILQERIIPCAEELRLFPDSVNTLRLVTIKSKTGEPKLLAKLHRIGTKETGGVDNFAAGGIAIGIEDNGFLKKYGLNRKNHTKHEKHPDTGIVFSQFKVPFLKESIELVLKAHKYFYNIPSIGWDVVLTEHGPEILEGNHDWGISSVQCCDRPIRKEWEEYHKN